MRLPQTDEELLTRVRDGDIRAFDTLYARYETRLFSYLRALLADRRDAEEIFHDAFMKALDAEPGMFVTAGFRPWLYKVARNMALNRMRATQRLDKNTEGAALTQAAETTQEDLEEVLAAAQVGRALDFALERLPPALLEVYHLRASGLSNEQIADLVEVPLGTVKSRCFRMITVLRKEMKPWIAS